MLSQCLNPARSAPFRYLREGRIFHREIPSTGETPVLARRQYFWLCGPCCSTFTVVVKDGAGIVQPRFLERVSGERVEQAEEEKPFLI